MYVGLWKCFRYNSPTRSNVWGDLLEENVARLLANGREFISAINTGYTNHNLGNNKFFYLASLSCNIVLFVQCHFYDNFIPITFHAFQFNRTVYCIGEKQGDECRLLKLCENAYPSHIFSFPFKTLRPEKQEV